MGIITRAKHCTTKNAEALLASRFGIPTGEVADARFQRGKAPLNRVRGLHSSLLFFQRRNIFVDGQIKTLVVLGRLVLEVVQFGGVCGKTNEPKSRWKEKIVKNKRSNIGYNAIFQIYL